MNDQNDRVLGRILAVEEATAGTHATSSAPQRDSSARADGTAAIFDRPCPE